VNKTTQQQLIEATLEIEGLAMQLADMLGVALHYAGVKEENMREAVEAYLNGIEELFADELDEEMGYEEMIQVIEYLKRTKPKLFC